MYKAQIYINIRYSGCSKISWGGGGQLGNNLWKGSLKDQWWKQLVKQSATASTREQWPLHHCDSKDEVFRFQCLTLEWIPAHFWVGRNRGSKKRIYSDFFYDVPMVGLCSMCRVLTGDSLGAGSGGAWWVSRCSEDTWRDHLCKALAPCCPLVPSGPPGHLFSMTWSCSTLTDHLPSSVSWHQHAGGSHREKRRPKVTDFLAGRSKGQEERKARAFHLCPSTLGENGPAAHTAVVILGNVTHKGARQRLEIFITFRGDVLWSAEFRKG